MASVNNCNLPEDLYYVVDKHVWARLDGELVTVGMTDVAQHLAKTIIAVTPKAVGKTVKKGRNVATVESGKWVGAVPAPVGGEIVAINEAVVASPGLANSDPYGAGWVARLRPSDWQADAADLVFGPDGVEAYRRFLDAEGIGCGELPRSVVRRPFKGEAAWTMPARAQEPKSPSGSRSSAGATTSTECGRR